MSTGNQEGTTATGSRCKSCCKLPFGCRDQLVAKWADGSTIHGMDHIFSGKSKVRRFVWALVVLAAIGGCLYSIIDRSIYFHSKPTATTVTTNTNEGGISFPSVTVCNLSPIKRSYAESHNLTEFLQYFLFTDTVLFDNRFLGESCLSLLSSIDQSSVGLPLRDIFMNGRFRNDDTFPFVQSCYFGHTHNVSNCVSNLQSTLTSNGVCYTFNTIDSVSRSAPLARSVGRRHGLRMTLNISQSEYIQSENADAGIKVFIHNSHEVPEPQDTAISVAPGSHATIALFPHAATTRPEISRCKPLHTVLEFFPGQSYSKSTCRLNEYFKKSVELCGCTDIATNIPRSGPYSNARNCTVENACCLYDAFVASSQDSSDCLPACEDLTYEPTVSYSQFPSNQAADVISLLSDIDMQVLESNILAINVYYGSVQTITLVTDYSYDVSALITDIGGALALFVGASVISFVEILFLCFDEAKRAAIFGGRKVEEKAKSEMEEHEMSLAKKEEDEEKQTTV